jgi:hypothetical protein
MVVDIQTSNISVIASGMTNTIFAMSNRHSTMTGIYSRPNVVRTGRSGDDFTFLEQEICQSKRKISHRVSDDIAPSPFRATRGCVTSGHTREEVYASGGFTLSSLRSAAAS